MSERLPVVSGAQLVRVLGKLGGDVVRKRGSHVRLELLPRSQTDLGTSHAAFGRTRVRRCSELEVEVPESLLAQIDDLNDRIKTVRDRIEHPQSPLSFRWIDGREGLKVGTRRVVRPGEDAMAIEFEPAGAVREAIHAYVNAMVDLLETARRSSA